MAEHQYKEYTYAFTSKGLSARFAIDKTPPNMYWNLLGLEVRQEGTLSSRLGRIPITMSGTEALPLADLNIHTLSRLKGVSGNTFRYAGAGENIYRIAGDANGAYTLVSGPAPIAGSSQGYAGLATDEGGLNPWANPANAEGPPDSLFATSTIVSLPFPAKVTTNGLLLTGFSLPPIPAGMIISGIQVTINGFQSNANVDCAVTAFLFFGSAAIGIEKVSAFPLSSGNVILGGQQDKWNTGLTPAQIIDPSFGVLLNGLIDLPPFAPGQTCTYSIDSVQITVFYSLPGVTSGNRFSSATYRPTFSSFPYIFFADSEIMLKDNGSFDPLEQWGIYPPLIPPTTKISGTLFDSVDLFGSISASRVGLLGEQILPIDFPKTYTNFTPPLTGAITSLVRASNFVVVTTAVPHGIPLTAKGDIAFAGVVDPSFDGTFPLVSVSSPTVFTCYTGLISSLPNASSTGGTFSCYQGFYRVNTTSISPITAGQLNTVTPASMANIVPGMILIINQNIGSQFNFVLVLSTTGSTFTAYFNTAVTGAFTIIDVPFSGTAAANSTASIVGQGLNLDLSVFNEFPFNSPAPPETSDSDLISFFYNLSVVANVTSLSIAFNVSNGNFTDTYSATVDLVGVSNNTWTQFSLQRGQFSKSGGAGTAGMTWANVNGYKLTLVTNSGGTVVLQVAGINLNAAGGPFVGPGSPYDYRYTYFDSNTGTESNPSVIQVQSAFLSPNNQPIIISLTPSLDPQVTNINIYRRGGTLNTGWTQVAQVPANTTSYTDSFSDAQIDSNNVLEIDNDPPLTVDLPVPVATNLGTAVTAGSIQTVMPGSMANIYQNQILTIDQGLPQEENVTVISTTASTFTAYFQTTHSNGSSVSADSRQGQPVNLATIAFDQAWLAGDPNNPNRLYYSKVTNPEAFPPENWIEIGTPADPITSIVFFRGQIFVFTEARIYRVIIPYPGAVPAPYPTSSRHGLYALFAFCISEGLIPYLSQDGIYIFTGDSSQYATQVIEWLFADKEPNLGPVPEQDPTQAANTVMAFTKNEFYVAYTDKTGTQRRVSYDFKNGTWRNDDVGATAMFFEEDTEELVIAENDDGMIYRDRRGDVDIDIVSPGTVGPIPVNINLQTACQDQGLSLNSKSYNELALDVDWPSPLEVTLLFDNGTSPLPLGSFQTTGRQRLAIPINAGVGRVSQNVVLQITGSMGLEGPGHFYNWYIKAAVEAEIRESFDTYWAKLGTDEYKIIKQGQFEYVAADPGGINFSVYVEGNLLTPAYTFNLPQASVRTAVRIRFPALKAKIWRFIATSATPFQLYGESFVEFKPITLNKGYAKENLGAMITAQGSV